MKGYYAIYSHSQDAWWAEGNYWHRQKEYITKNLPMGYTVSLGTNVGGASANATHYENVVIDNSNYTFNPYNIRRFDTLNEAETYLLSGHIYMNPSIDFVTIRKIYM